MRLNAGSFQNVAHLHLKVRMDPTAFQAAWASNKAYAKLKATNSSI